jgi:hypothetical protein
MTSWMGEMGFVNLVLTAQRDKLNNLKTYAANIPF